MGGFFGAVSRRDIVLDVFFGKGEPVEMYDRIVTPIAPSDEMLENIYYHNALRFIKKEQ